MLVQTSRVFAETVTYDTLEETGLWVSFYSLIMHVTLIVTLVSTCT